MSVTLLTNENFEAEALKCELPVLIDFYADWCGPCKMVSPIIDEVSEERCDVKICKVNVDSSPELAEAFGIQSIPSLVVIRDGKTVAQTVGAMSKELLVGFIDETVAE